MIAADEWSYRIEGNNNVVFANITKGCILRLPKVRKRNQNQKLSGLPNHDLSQEIEFLEHVIYRMLKNLQVRYKGVKVNLTKEFINQLSQKMAGKRPQKYEGEMLDESTQCGLLLPNFCYFLSHKAINFSIPLVKVRSHCSTPVISVELRPKSCYIPILESGMNSELYEKCFFCLSKIYNHVSSGNPQTKYCPNDLYSGNSFRIKRAIKDLIACPQRYFSVRINDQDVYSGSTLTRQYSEITCTGSRKALNCQIFDHGVSSHLGDNGREAFLNLVCTSLSSSVMAGIEEKRKSKQHTSRTKPHCRRRQSFSEEMIKKNKENSNNLSILSFLDSVQSIQKLPLQVLVEMHSKLKSHLEEHEEDFDALSLGSPYNVSEWQNATKLLSASNGNFHQSNTQKLDITETAEILRQYIIARSFKCCSIIITLQEVQQEENYNSTQEKNGDSLISDGFGRMYRSLISIIDLDKDHAAPVEKTYKREREIIKYLNDYFSKLKKK